MVSEGKYTQFLSVSGRSLRHPFPALVSCSVFCINLAAACRLVPAVCRSGAGLSRLPSSLPASRAPGPFRRPRLRLSLRQPRPRTAARSRTGSAVPGIVERCLPGANQGPTAPGNVENRLPGANQGPTAPGNVRRCLPGANQGPTAPGIVERCLPGANQGPTAPGNVRRCLPGANQGPTAPGNVENRLPGAKRPVFAPGREETRSPGAEIGQCAPGSAKRFVARSGGKQGGRADGLSRARVFPRGPISARGKHGHPAGLFYWVLLFPTTYICRCRHTRSPLSSLLFLLSPSATKRDEEVIDTVRFSEISGIIFGNSDF